MVVIFNLNMTIDKTFIIPDFKKGFIYRLDPNVIRCGGKGANVARAFSRFDNNYLLMGFCCGYTGRLIIEYLKKERLNNLVIYQKEGESRICISVIDKYGVSTDINEEGPFITKNSMDRFLDKFKKFSKKITTLVVSGRTPRGVTISFFNEIFNILKSRNIDVYVDVTSNILLKFINFGCHTVKINAGEFMEISGCVNSEKSIFDFYKKYSKDGLRNIIVTDRSNKTIAVCDGKIFTVFPPVIKDLISEVGAGDSFMAGLVYAKTKGFDNIKSLKLATAFSSSDVLTPGAGSIIKADVIKYFKKVIVREVQ